MGWPWFPGRHRKKLKPRVYLGTLAVAPRSDLKRHADRWMTESDLEPILLAGLRDLFTLPHASEINEPQDTDLVLDVMVPAYQGGLLLIGDGDLPGIPIFWRPKVTVAARLYWYKTEKTRAAFKVTERMKRREFLHCFWNLSRMLRLQPMITGTDMDALLRRACWKLVLKVNRAI